MQLKPQKRKRTLSMTVLLLALTWGGLASPVISQVLETEESKPLLAKQFEFGTGLEFQTSSEGTETALPLAFEYGLSDRLTFLLEPVLFTTIRPKKDAGTTGVGDLEMTLFYQLVNEKSFIPSISIAGEVKIPTARNALIGTGKTDYSPILIATKTTGPFLTSINLSYSFLGKPAGSDISNIFSYAVGELF